MSENSENAGARFEDVTRSFSIVPQEEEELTQKGSVVLKKKQPLVPSQLKEGDLFALQGSTRYHAEVLLAKKSDSGDDRDWDIAFRLVK